MHKFARLSVFVFAVLSVLFQTLFPTGAAAAQASGCQEGQQSSGARYQFCLPDGTWNGDLVVYAHGYVPPGSPLALPGEAGQFAAPLRGLGYAFATTSYRVNGLAVLPAQDDLLNLVQIFRAAHRQPKRIFLIGASEGGLITTLAIEHYPDVFSGGLEMCGPVGSFQDQINYFGDFRVAFDTLFPGVIPANPVEIPGQLIAQWPGYYQQYVLPVLLKNSSREKLIELMKITGAAYDPSRPETLENTARGVLGYNIYATNDAAEKLGGQPFDNQARQYTGSADDAQFNQTVQRITADPGAREALLAYQTTGQISVPLVALHTTGDEIVPFFHLERYQQKVSAAGRGDLFESIPVERYGHCKFTSQEILDAFNRLVQKANAPRPAWTATPSVTVTRLPSATPVITSTPVPASSPTASAPAGGLARFWSWLVHAAAGLVQLGKG